MRIKFCDITREISLVQSRVTKCERMQNSVLVAVRVAWRNFSFVLGIEVPTHPYSGTKGRVMPRTFHSRIREKIFTSRRPWRNLTEIGLEIPGEGRVNFRHLVVSSARHQKSYLQQKSNRLERTTEETRCIIKNRHAIWIAFVTQMWNSPSSSSPQSKLRWDCKSCLSERERRSLWPLGSIQMTSVAFRRNFCPFKRIGTPKLNGNNISKIHAFILWYISIYHRHLFLIFFILSGSCPVFYPMCLLRCPTFAPIFYRWLKRVSHFLRFQLPVIPFARPFRTRLSIPIHLMTILNLADIADVMVANSIPQSVLLTLC